MSPLFSARRVLGMLLLVPVAGQAVDLLNVNFTAHLNPGYRLKEGPAGVGISPTDFWNVYSRDLTSMFEWRDGGLETNLLWANGSSSSINLTVENAPGYWQTGSPDPMFDSYLYPLGGGNINISLSPLPPGTYDLYCYAHGAKNAENALVGVEINGVSFGDKATLDGPGWDDELLVEGVDYVVFGPLPVAAEAALAISVAPGADAKAVINGLQLVRSADAPPVLGIIPAGGAFTGSVEVRIESSISGIGSLRYTLDGSDPTLDSPVYSGVFALTDETTVKARLFINGYVASDIVSAHFTPASIPAIEFLPTETLFTNEVFVALVNGLDAGAIRYTVDGSPVVEDSAVYSAPLRVTHSITIEARVFFNTFPISEVYRASYSRVYCFSDDGIPFDWREMFFGAGFLIDHQAAADADPDGDGYTNLEEFQVGTSPIDKVSVPETVLEVRAVPRIRFSCVPGREYQVLRKSSLSDPDWEVVVRSVVADDTAEVWIDADAPETSYYLVIEVPRQP